MRTTTKEFDCSVNDSIDESKRKSTLDRRVNVKGDLSRKFYNNKEIGHGSSWDRAFSHPTKGDREISRIERNSHITPSKKDDKAYTRHAESKGTVANYHSFKIKDSCGNAKIRDMGMKIDPKTGQPVGTDRHFEGDSHGETGQLFLSRFLKSISEYDDAADKDLKEHILTGIKWMHDEAKINYIANKGNPKIKSPQSNRDWYSNFDFAYRQFAKSHPELNLKQDPYTDD